jgi:hypothetical protein
LNRAVTITVDCLPEKKTEISEKINTKWRPLKPFASSTSMGSASFYLNAESSISMTSAPTVNATAIPVFSDIQESYT